MTNANQRRLYKQSKQQQQPQPQSGGSVHPPAAEGDNRRQEGQAGLSQSTGSKRKRTDASSETTAAEGSSAAKRRETDSTSEPTAATDADSPALPLSAPLPVPSSHTKSAALEYLRQWREEKDMWKFNKVKQSFLLQHALDRHVLPKQSFSALLDYIAPLQGAARQRLLDEARRCISQAGDEASKQQPRDKTKAADGEGDQQNSSAESAAASTDHSAADKAKDLKRAVQRAWKIVKVLS